ncbi:LPS O-antigen chain length determinant protein WzzB [Pseudomonas hormoni]
MQEIKSDKKASGEVDLFDFLRAIWVQRWLILVVSAVVTLISGAYAFLSTPVYEVRAYVLPPEKNDVDVFRLHRLIGGGSKVNSAKSVDETLTLDSYSIKSVYGAFTRNLQSESLRHKFFIEVYLPSLSEAERKKPEGLLYRQFSESLSIVPPKEIVDKFMVVAQTGHPVETAKWLDQFVDQIGKATKEDLLKSFSAEINTRIQNIDSEIVILRNNAAVERKNSIVRLREAMKISRAIGLDNQMIISGSVSKDLSGAIDPTLIYLRGTKALAAEVENMEARESDDAYIRDLPKLQGLSEFYKTISLKPENVAVYRLDGVIAPPDSPIKPRKTLIILMGLAMGLMFGIILGVIRHFWGGRVARGFHERDGEQK